MMITEYLKKMRKLVKWLVPFGLAILLLFGCGRPEQSRTRSGDTASQAVQSQAAQSQAVQSQAVQGQAAQSQAVQSQAVQGQPAQSPPDQSRSEAGADDKAGREDGEAVAEDGSYTGKEDVALYLHTYGKLPANFITKQEAEAAGWNSREGNLWEVAPGRSIGGSRFGNYEKKLPQKEGRVWKECDINYDGTYRGAERILYSNDGLIYYTKDHYQTFEQLY